MDPAEIVALSTGFIQDAAIRHLLFVVVALFILAGVVGLIVSLGEKALGFNIKGAIDSVEKSAERGEPIGIAGVVVLLAAGIFSLAWIAVTVIRP